MKEDRAAGTRTRRVVIVAEHDEEIVERVFAPHRFGACRIGQAHRTVVGRIARRIAPAVTLRNRTDRQARGRRGQAVGPVPQLPKRKKTDRRGAVALALVVTQSAAPQRTGKIPRAENQAAACFARICGDFDICGSGHDRIRLGGDRAADQPGSRCVLQRLILVECLVHGAQNIGRCGRRLFVLVQTVHIEAHLRRHGAQSLFDRRGIVE